MKNKNVLITGSSYGIGFEIAKNLVGSVNNLIITSRNKKKLISSKKKLVQKIVLYKFVTLKKMSLLTV